MPSKSRSAAARANGAKSKGPTTEAGKAKSARNSLKHGLTSKEVALICELPEEFDDLRDAYIEQFQPDNQVEMDLVEALAAARFRLRRLLTRYENSLNCTFDRSLKQLQVLQKSRLATPIQKVRNEPKLVLPSALSPLPSATPALLPLNPCETSSFLAPVAQATRRPSTQVVPV